MSSNVSKSFKDTIKAYLDDRAKSDELFAKVYANEKKDINGCCNYILQEVRKMQVQGLTDDEVYGIAVHYYDETDLGEIKGAGCDVIVNHHVELTEEEKEQARKNAVARYENEQLSKLRQANTHKVAKKPNALPKPTQKSAPKAYSPSLFDSIEDETEE